MALAFTHGILGKSGMPMVFIICGTLIYYHCAVRHTSLVSLLCDVLIVLLCSLAVLGLMFRKLNISVPVDPLQWQVSQKTADNVSASIANTIGAAESVFRVASSGHDKKLLCKVVVVLYVLSVVGRAISGATVVYAGKNLNVTTECRQLRKTLQGTETDITLVYLLTVCHLIPIGENRRMTLFIAGGAWIGTNNHFFMAAHFITFIFALFHFWKEASPHIKT